jgi:hypothetical protein
MADDKSDDAAARKARADAIRRARDRQNAPADDSTTADTTDPNDPNYVAFIDRKMREEKKERKP